MNEGNAKPGLDANLKLIGEAAALQVIVLALIESHPAPETLAESLHRLSEHGFARLLPAECPDAMVQAYQAVAEGALRLVREQAAKTGR